MECTENRKFDLNNIPDKLPEEAWTALKKASNEKDLEEFREVGYHCSLFLSLFTIKSSPVTDHQQSLKIYSKAVPQATFVDIEKKLREEDFKIYLIAMVRATLAPLRWFHKVKPVLMSHV